jgi:XTP/dITP diphosphohydrolase
MPQTILIATTNKGKLREITELIGDLPLHFIDLADPSLPDMPPASEDGDTFEENAILKARYYGNLTNMPTIAEDAGLQIPVLDGWPGVRSSRVASSDEERVALVLNKMKGREGEDRLAMFVSVAAFFDPVDDNLETFLGVCQGSLLEEPRGYNGFGYDPIFYHPGYGLTMAEISTADKNLVSHRGQSVRSLARWLKGHYGEGSE